MRVFQDQFEKMLQNNLDPAAFISRLIAKKVKQDLNIDLSKEQQRQLQRGLQAEMDKGGLSESLHIEMHDKDKVLVFSGHSGDTVSIDIGDIGAAEIDKIEQLIPALVDEIADLVSTLLLRDLKKRNCTILRDHKHDLTLFEKNLNQQWGKAIDLLELFILISQEVGGEYNDFILHDQEFELSPRFEVLRRAHARSCQVALEILTLLKNGFADGAYARWRTLHEIAVESNLIRNGDDELAGRFLNHDIVREYKSAKTYQKHCTTLHYDPIPANEMSTLEKSYQDIIKRYGKEYANDNGWAVKLVKNSRPGFNDLESLANFEHMRPFYKLACMNIHSGPGGLIYRLGLTEAQHENVLLAGPSTNGLGDPIQNTAYSLLQTTSSLLTDNSNMDYLVAVKILCQLESDIFNAVEAGINDQQSSEILDTH